MKSVSLIKWCLEMKKGFKFDEVDDDIKIAKKKYQTFFKKTL